MPKKKEPLTFEQMQELLSSVMKALELLERHQEEIWRAYGVKSRQARALDKAITLLRQEMPLSLEKSWDILNEDNYDIYPDTSDDNLWKRAIAGIGLKSRDRSK